MNGASLAGSAVRRRVAVMGSACHERGNARVATGFQIRVRSAMCVVRAQHAEERVTSAHFFPVADWCSEDRLVEFELGEHLLAPRVSEVHRGPTAPTVLARWADAMPRGRVAPAGHERQEVADVEHHRVARDRHADPPTILEPDFQTVVHVFAIQNAGDEPGDETRIRVLTGPHRAGGRVGRERVVGQIPQQRIPALHEVRQEAGGVPESFRDDLEGELHLATEVLVERVHVRVESGHLRHRHVVANVLVHRVVRRTVRPVVPVLLQVAMRGALADAEREVHAALATGFPMFERELLFVREEEDAIRGGAHAVHAVGREVAEPLEAHEAGVEQAVPRVGLEPFARCCAVVCIGEGENDFAENHDVPRRNE